MAGANDGLQGDSENGLRSAKRRRKWPWVVLLLLLGFFAALPSAIRLSLVEFLPRAGFDTVEVGGVEFNPAFGTFAIRNLKLVRNGGTVLSVGAVELDLALKALFDRHIDFEVLRLRGVKLTLRTEPDGAVEVAGIPIPAGGNDQSAPPASGPPWGVGWQGIVIEDLTVHHVQQGVKTDLTIANASLDRAASWAPDADSELQISGRIDNGAYKLHARLKPFSPKLDVDADIGIDDLDGGHFAALGPSDFKGTTGLLSLAGQLRLALTDKGPSVDFDGGAGLKRFGIGFGGYTVRNDGLDLKGRFALTPADKGGVITWSGDLALSGLAVKNASGPLLDLPKLTVSGASQAANGDISIDRIAMKAPHARIAVDPKGRVNLVASETAPPAPAPEAPASSAQAATSSPRIRVKHFELTESRIDISDQSVKPVYRSQWSVERFRLDKLDSGRPDIASDWSIKGRIGAFSKIDVHGKVKPFSELPDASVLGTLRSLPLQTLSGYSAKTIGYFIDSGQADADIDVKAVKGELSGKIGMRIARIEVSPAEQDKIDQLTAQLSMPLPSALSVLKNDDDEITLSLPLAGNTSAPDFGVAPLINKLLGIALKQAAVGYLSNLLQPYATVFTVAKFALNAASKISLDPLVFTDGKADVEPDSAPYVGKLGKLLGERPELTLRVCGIATQGDAAALAVAAKAAAEEQEKKKSSSGKKASVQPAPAAEPEISEDTLEHLASTRSEYVKRVLVEQYKIDPARLFLCRPQVDNDPQGRSRVELAI
ncbi:MAG: DUF748 domain-containing protein [Gammaproteobacteria bacterium]|nr:DUF748 domain-containing protein [Gammaproteobacteria bacterium]